MATKIPLLGHKMIEFKVKKEPFNYHKLEDGAFIKTKYILLMVHFEKDIPKILEKKDKSEKLHIESGINLNGQILMAVDVPDNLKGIPNRKPDTNLKEHVIKNDLEVVESKEYFFEYELENDFIIKGKSILLNVDKTDCYDDTGVPIYLFDHSVELKIIPPKSIQERMLKK